MSEVFDSIAYKYDKTFTKTAVGKAQRISVWNYLKKKTLHEKYILELNCGTCEDAVFFAENGANILATDISAEMLNFCKLKIKPEFKDKIKLQKLDILDISELKSSGKFDYVFSNFGGINCVSIDSLIKFSSEIKKNIKPEGSIIMVIMSKFCLWEILYYSFKLDFKTAFRRFLNKKISVKIGDNEIDTYYYSPKKIAKAFKDYQIETKMPVNFAVPPSYLNSFFERHKKTLEFLIKIDKILGKLKLFAIFSDHFLIELKLKQE
ncbi:MAG: class I SAM-dependent methyltransferase [Bacteroidales bacterium]|nr:class I SAM-dependent methyltransferase [Bacteroidales bacterium]MBN2757940.1 class I SAM-dependent methyltransferase [Bacteroidales bacterium]